MKSMIKINPGTITVTHGVTEVEEWPVLQLEDYGKDVTMPYELYERYMRVEAERAAVQEELRKLFEGEA